MTSKRARDNVTRASLQTNGYSYSYGYGYGSDGYGYGSFDYSTPSGRGTTPDENTK